MEDIVADVMQRILRTDMDRCAGSLSIGTQIADQMHLGSSLRSEVSAGISAIDHLNDYSDFARASVIGAQIPDLMNLGSSLRSEVSAGISAIDHLNDYSDFARASVIGAQIPGLMDLGSSLRSEVSAGISAIDHLNDYSDFARASVIGAQIPDLMNLGSSLGSEVLAGISAIDHLNDYSDFARASVIGAREPDRISINSKSSLDKLSICGQKKPIPERYCKIYSESENRAEADIVQSIQGLLITCNRAKKINGKDAIFKYTDKFVEAIVTLSRINSGDEHNLGDLVDALYLLIYEGAGKDKLRFLCDFGGPLKSQDCEFVWNLKILRNKWLRHDIEHGNEKSIKRSWKELKKALDFFGLDELPTDRDEFKYLHLNIIYNAKIVLTLMHDAVIENHAS
jgi:hypothetical protein